MPTNAQGDARETNQSETINHIATIESNLHKLLKKLDSISAPVNNPQNHKPNFNSPVQEPPEVCPGPPESPATSEGEPGCTKVALP